MEQPITTSTISEPVSVVNDNDQNNKLVPCCFCNTDIIDEVNLGALRQTYGFRAHYYCLLLSSTISQSGKDHRGIQGFTAGDIKKELRNCENRVCCYCRQNFANLKCMYTYKKKKCNRFFHLPCGLRHFTGHEFFGMFKSYCHSHRAVCQIPKDIRGCFGHVECVICLEIVNVDCDVRELYMPNCCKRKAIMHVSCLKHYALQAGYYMKCPMCNNTNDFIANIIKFGVFVPMRDALWEKRSAYGDLER